MKLYYAETMNPRKTCATAKHLGIRLEYEKIELGKGEQKHPAFLARNPNGKVPVLVDGDLTLWESLAIMVHLSNVAGSDLWPANDPSRQVEVLRWTTWGSLHFGPHASVFYFERIIKPRLLGLSPDDAAIERATPAFRSTGPR